MTEEGRTSQVHNQDLVWGHDLSSPWTRLVMGVRPIWHATILLFIAIQPIAMWERGIVSVFAAIFGSTNILLLTRSDNPHWKTIVSLALDIELWSSAVAAVALSVMIPESPAPLILLPSLTGLIMRDNQTGFHAGVAVLSSLASFLLDFRLGMGWLPAQFLAQSALSQRYSSVRLSSALLLGLYLTLACSLIVIALLVRHQSRQTHQLQEMMSELQRKSEELSHRHAQLNEFADKVSQLAATEERNRIASEIHDTVAHRLTALFVQLQAATRQLSLGHTDTAKDNLAVSEALTRESLEAVRSSVRSLRKTSANEGLNALRRLTTQYASLTGMTITTTFEDPLEGIPPVILALLYRVIQEGLTNAKRHGRASEVKIRLNKKGLSLYLEVRDNGRGAPSPAYGFGLSTMQERVHSLGGQLSVDTQPGQGFALCLRVPAFEEMTT